MALGVLTIAQWRLEEALCTRSAGARIGLARTRMSLRRQRCSWSPPFAPFLLCLDPICCAMPLFCISSVSGSYLLCDVTSFPGFQVLRDASGCSESDICCVTCCVTCCVIPLCPASPSSGSYLLRDATLELHDFCLFVSE